MDDPLPILQFFFREDSTLDMPVTHLYKHLVYTTGTTTPQRDPLHETQLIKTETPEIKRVVPDLSLAQPLQRIPEAT